MGLGSEKKTKWAWARGILVVLALLLVPGLASAQNNPLVQTGTEQYDELRYEEALQTLSAALVREGNSSEDSQTIYRLLAYTYLALGRDAEAQGAYRLLLAQNPEFEPGNEVSPRYRTFFGEVKRDWEEAGRPGAPPPRPVRILHRSPAQADAGDTIEVTAELEDPGGRVASMVLAVRPPGEEVFERLDMARGPSGFAGQIPSSAVSPPFVEYYFEAVDRTGLPVASRGDVAAPQRIAVPEESSSVFEEWWFWVGAAVIVGAAVTTGILLAGSEEAPPPPGTFVITIR